MTKRAFVIEDDPAVLTMITHLLSHEYEVAVAPSAVNWEKKLTIFKPDVLILDLMLPEISGIDFCKAVRASAAFKNLPILVLSAAGRSMIMEAMRAGADNFIAKPFDPKILLYTVGELVNRPRRADQVVQESLVKPDIISGF